MPQLRSLRHILVVEDDPDQLHLVTEVLEGAGYSVARAEDGVRALSHLRSVSRRPDLILLDLQMPNMSGVELREEQLKNAELAATPVVLMSADDTGKEKATALNASAFLGKPLVIPQLLELIRRILGASRGTGEDTK